ncbi:MAG: ligase-associated DNA damage response endonuclease PdeM [Steroidobacteraceae bacterium]
MLEITLAGERVQLCEDGALHWPARRTLVLGDPHFGKDDHFRRAGIAVPRGPTLRDLERVSARVAASEADRMIVVGDFVHGRTLPGDDLVRQFHRWRAIDPTIEVVLVTGNHDRHEDWSAWRDLIHVVHGDLHEGPFVFAHEPRPDPRGFVVAGHLHPVYRDRRLLGARSVRVFWKRADHLVLPSWGEFTGGFAVTPDPADGLYACTPEGVLPLQTGKPT